MLHSLDILIGVTTVMLLLSLVVTAVTQAVLDLFGLRSAHLREGILQILTRSGLELHQAKTLLDDSHLKFTTQVSVADLSSLAGRMVSGDVFDATMAKTSDRFTASSRVVVAATAVAIAVALPLDTLDLIRIFSTTGGIVLFPATFPDWVEHWRHVNVAGIGLSAVLLSLGAPFWFEILKDLLKLRGQAAQ